MNGIHIETYGFGPTLVMLHGWAMHTGIWRTFARQLAENYRVVCVDLPGHGLSETIEPFSLRSLTDCLLEAVPEERCCWLGWSLGATVAWYAAANNPDRVGSVIAISGNPRFIGSRDWPGMPLWRIQDFAGDLQRNGKQTLLRFLGLQVQGTEKTRFLLKELKKAIAECAEPDEKTLHDGLKILTTTDLTGTLTDINCPLMFIIGAKDNLVPVTVASAVSDLSPGVEVRIIDQAGHVPFITHEQQVKTIISEFLNR